MEKGERHGEREKERERGIEIEEGREERKGGSGILLTWSVAVVF